MQKLIPFASLFALVIGVFTVMTVAGAFDDDDPQAVGDIAGSEGVSAVCAEGFEDCNDTIVVNDGDSDDEADLPTGDSDDLTETCLADATDCNDFPLEEVDDPGAPPPNNATTEAEALAIDAAFAALEVMNGPPSSAVDVSGVEAVDWSDACLGVETAGALCIQVITPGFIVFLSSADGDYEFHTDARGKAVFFAND